MMSFDIKNIHIGKIIRQKAEEKGIETKRIQNFLNCSENEIQKMYENPSIETDLLLRWSKLLKYDFFRVYVQHIILFSPPEKIQTVKKQKQSVPVYRKNIYTKEIIDFILELLNEKKKTRTQIIGEYRIPKTTLYKWIEKYNHSKKI
nr:transposase [Chryseobacterium sp.]